ncbi:MAG: hypothetical protein HGB23_03770 [Chlorobiaceae bacterium]|nr:hypothetical protein [Chlorobiaceae bacterium]
MSVEESNEFDELMEIVNEEEIAVPQGEGSEEEEEPETPILKRGGTSAG